MNELREIEKAIEFDSTLKFSPGTAKLLTRKYIKPQTYSRKKLFDNMYAGKTIVFSDYPVELGKQSGENTKEVLISLLKKGLPQTEKINIRAGLNRSLYRVTIDHAIERWVRQKSKFGVTDLHFRDTKFYNNIDAESISYFNLLPGFPYEVSFLEMLTLVISSKGIFSDSHSDDGDGSNHCFVGKKLWLAWDGREGKKAGLQDCTHDTVYEQAAFNMKKFSQLNSSHWFVISDNRTLFMPGNFTHKVITLEPYIGFGSFYVSFPNYINTCKRWALYDTGDVKGDFLNIMNSNCIKKIKKVEQLSEPGKEKMGLCYIQKAAKNWKHGLTNEEISLLENNEKFKKLINTALSL